MLSVLSKPFILIQVHNLDLWYRNEHFLAFNSNRSSKENFNEFSNSTHKTIDFAHTTCYNMSKSKVFLSRSNFSEIIATVPKKNAIVLGR